MKIRTLSIVGLVFLTHPIFAQLSGLTFHHLTMEKGLSKGENHFVYKDKTGFVWISSTVGLNRFDGRVVKVYQPDKNDKNAISGENIQSTFFEDKNEDLWFTIYGGGVTKYVRSEDSFENFIVKDSLGEELVEYYAFFFDKDQSLWLIINGRELYRFNTIDLKFTKILDFPEGILRAVVQTDNNNEIKRIFAYSYLNTGLYSVQNDNGNFIVEKYFGVEHDVTLAVKSILPMADSLIWIGAETGLYLFNLNSKKLKLYDAFNEIKISSIFAIVPLSPNELLLASKGLGLLTFDLVSKKFTDLVVPDGSNPYSLSTNDFDGIYIDKDGGWWVSTSPLGIDYVFPQKKRFESFKIDKTVNGNSVQLKPGSMVEDEQGCIWCSVDLNGICVFDKQKKIIKRINHIEGDPNSIPSNEIIFLNKTKDNRIWILTWKGIAVWLPDKKKIFNLPLFKSAIINMLQLEDGRIILAPYGESGEKGGLYELIEKKSLDFTYKKIDNINTDHTYTILWQASNGNIYSCNSLLSISQMKPASNISVISEIPITGDVSSFYEDSRDHSLWIGSSTGLYHLQPERENQQIEVFTEKNGLPSRVIYGMLPDKKNKLWISTNKGLVSFEIDSIKAKVFTQIDGLISSDFLKYSFLKHSSGQFWFGSSTGITCFFPEKVKPITLKATPRITNIFINDQPSKNIFCEKTGAANVSEFERLKLNYLTNTVSFNFAALEYSDPSKTKFQYKLEGVDKDWVNSETNNFARYPKIPYGNNVFKLKASNSDGIWSDPISLSIKVSPPFTKTPWFYMLIAFGATGLIWFYFDTRRKRQEELRRLDDEKREALELERQRIARDVHDDLGSGLSALSLQTAMAQYKNSPEEIKTELEKANLVAIDLSGKIREVIWTVSAKNDTLANLISYLNQYAIDLLENTDIDLLVNLPEIIPQISVTGEYRRTTFLAFKEALNNMLKHANASQVAINFKLVGNNLHIVVADNGIGFDPNLLEQSTGNGLLNMQTRMRDIGSDCHFETNKEGATITFILKLKTA